MSRRKNTRLFLLIVPVFLLVFAFCPKVEAAAGNLLSICTQNGSQYYPASAWNSDKSEYLTVWFNDADPNRGIYGVRLGSDGNIKPNSSTFKIASIKGGGIYSPSVACNPQKNQYLVTWQDQNTDSASATRIRAAIVSFDGAGKPKTNLIKDIKKAKEKPSSPKVAWNGEQYLIVWYDYRGEPPTGLADADIYGVRIDQNGKILDPDSLEICTADSAQTDPVITGYQKSGESGEKGWLVAWVDARDASSGKNIYAILMKQNADATVSKGESFPICQADKDQQSVSVATGPLGFFVVWLDGRLKDMPNGSGGSYGNFLIGSCVSFDGQLLPTRRGGMDILIAGLNPDIRVSGDVAGVTCIQNNYLVVWDDGSTVYGTRISMQGDILDVQGGMPKPLTLSDTHQNSTFPSLASSADSGTKALITWMVADGAQITDISGVIYTLPLSPKLDWADGASSGVTPNQGEGGTNFTFKVKYTKAEGGGGDPLLSLFVLDLNRNGIPESNEVFNLDKTSPSSNIYQKTIPVLYDGTDPDDPNSYILSYYFYFQDEYNAAEGDPTKVHTVKITPHGEVPQLSWQGEGGYVQDGVNPDSSEDDTEFTFQVKYQDADGVAPRTYQVWIDLNGDGAFENLGLKSDGTFEHPEKFDMKKGDGNYTDGVTYTFNKSIKVDRVGLIAYRFYFDDKYNVAQGEPKETRYLAITNVSETCVHSGPNDQKLPDIASTSQGSLVVWEDLRDVIVDQKVPDLYQGSVVYRLFLDNQGKKVDRSEIRIGTGQSQFKPRVAASLNNNIYLAVWQDLRDGWVEPSGSNRGYVHTDIYGQIVDADNPASQIEIPIAASNTSDPDYVTKNQNNPAVAAGADNKFLAVWEDCNTIGIVGKNIHGAIISYNPVDSSAHVGNENCIINDQDYKKDKTNPAVAWGEQGQSYLVVWQDYRPELDDEVNSHLYANPVDTNGQVMDGQKPKEDNVLSGNPICADPNTTQENPAIASDGDKFLVVWEHKSTGPSLYGKDIYGILVRPNGAIAGQSFIICRAKGDQTNPRVSWDKINKSYLVVWTSRSFTKNIDGESELGYDTDIRGARLDATGKLLGGTVDSAGWEICTLQGNQESPAISGNEQLNQVIWMDNRAYPYAFSYDYDTAAIPLPVSYGYDIYSIPLKSFLSWVESDGLSYGVNPGSGDNGKTYIFQINYLDLAGNSPKVSEVWIDLDGDGTYAEGEKYPMVLDNYGSKVADGKVYTKSIGLTIPDNYQGNGWISYRFYFEGANSSHIAGNANLSKTFQIILPLASITGETNYQYYDVNPPYGVPGTTFKFRIKYTYTPLDTEYESLGPDDAQIWIDESQDGQYQSGEKHDLTEVDKSDTDYTDGKIYSYSFTGNKKGNYLYRFYFKHTNGGKAIGPPTQDHLLYIIDTGGGSTPSTKYPTWTTYNKKSGLANDQVFSFAIQDNNILWVGTAAGLNGFNAAADPNRAWATITPANAPNLAGSSITALAFDSSSNVLYVGTSQGLSSFDGSTWKKYDKSTTDGLLEKNWILALAFDKVRQELWIASAPGSQAAYNQTAHGLMGNPPGQYNLSKNQSRFAAPDPNNAALIQYNSSRNTWDAYNTENTNGGLPSNNIMALAVDCNGDVWVSTRVFTGTTDKPKVEYKGISRFKPDPASSGWTQYNISSNNNGILGTNYIWKIVGDAHNNLWVGGMPPSVDVDGNVDGTDGGLYRFDLQDNKWADHFYKGKKGVTMGSNCVTALAMDADGYGIWIATLPKGDGSGKTTGGGVSLYDGSSWKLFTTDDGLVYNFVTAIAVQGKDEKDNDGKNKKDVWFATPYGLSRYGCGPGDSESPHSYFDPKNRFAYPDTKGCFVNSLDNPLNQNSPFNHREPWSGWILLVISLLGTGIASPSMVRRYLWVRR